MSGASDISNLFQTLGVSPSHYQEVGQTERAQGGRERWPTQAEPAPVATWLDDAACEAALESAPVLPTPPEQPVLQPRPDPVVDAEQPAALRSVFARLLDGDTSQADVAPRQTS
ncbi:BcsR/BcsP family cellulose biosynthesis protein [Paraburkholderia sp. BCC1885]|uniref:BcsR/BcsP family cellulose biosynthesis protein n=1 Tax=Paraburkholderia sp. BCC1885 TaxID=2562669 RepID=UPI0011833D61|nr:BcsR/BcsP family cellulose biosynthesis protein [Paraburkholderia sp. BCC1885]